MSERSITDDVNIKQIRPLLPPQVLMDEFPLSEATAQQICRSRESVANIIHGKDTRLLVVVGPCSIHDPIAAIDYAERLQAVVNQYQQELLLVMRVYFEKPRTTVGWKGLINDPDINGSFNINQGLRTARQLLLQIAELGLPSACEILDMISPQSFTDLISWAAVGARTTESQTHREMASGLSVPVGFKNGTDGNVKIAVDAVATAAHPHHFLTITKQGVSAIAATEGNKNGHIILRGASSGPNYQRDAIHAAVEQLRTRQLPTRLMVDCSHGNSKKDYNNQPLVAQDLATQMAEGNQAICGIMLESHIHEGRQEKPEKYGVSITDACISWQTTLEVLDILAEGVRARQAL